MVSINFLQSTRFIIIYLIGPKKETEWGTGNANNGWGDPRSADPRQAPMDPRDIRQDMRSTNNSEAIRLLDHREQMRQMTSSDMRGDPRGND